MRVIDANVWDGGLECVEAAIGAGFLTESDIQAPFVGRIWELADEQCSSRAAGYARNFAGKQRLGCSASASADAPNAAERMPKVRIHDFG